MPSRSLCLTSGAVSGVVPESSKAWSEDVLGYSLWSTVVLTLPLVSILTLCHGVLLL